MEESIGRNFIVSVGDVNLCTLGVPYILAGCEPQGYMAPYFSLMKKNTLLKCVKIFKAFFHSVMWGLRNGNFQIFDASLTKS